MCCYMHQHAILCLLLMWVFLAAHTYQLASVHNAIQAEALDQAQDPDSAPSSPSSSEQPAAAPGADSSGSGGPSGRDSSYARAEATDDFQTLGAERAKRKSALREWVLPA